MKRIIPFVFVLFILSCDNSMTFNSRKWKPIESGLHGENYRKKMVFDLVNNVLNFGDYNNLKGTSLTKVEKLIGEPYRKDTVSNLLRNFSYYYQVNEKYDYNIDPNGGINLELEFDKDSTLINWTINEYWFRP